MPPCGIGCSDPRVKLLASSKEFLMAGNPSFDVFKLPDEHNELRAVLRDLCEKEIAPHAADVDEKARYTDEALAALTSSGFAAIHIPEEYGGPGGDSVAACIVIEEVARVCASSSLIPICNKLGTMGLLMRGSEELKKQVLPSIAAVRPAGRTPCPSGKPAVTPVRCGPARAGKATNGCSTAPSAGSPTGDTRRGTR